MWDSFPLTLLISVRRRELLSSFFPHCRGVSLLPRCSGGPESISATRVSRREVHSVAARPGGIGNTELISPHSLSEWLLAPLGLPVSSQGRVQATLALPYEQRRRFCSGSAVLGGSACRDAAAGVRWPSPSCESLGLYCTAKGCGEAAWLHGKLFIGKEKIVLILFFFLFFGFKLCSVIWKPENLEVASL